MEEPRTKHQAPIKVNQSKEQRVIEGSRSNRGIQNETRVTRGRFVVLVQHVMFPNKHVTVDPHQVPSSTSRQIAIHFLSCISSSRAARQQFGPVSIGPETNRFALDVGPQLGTAILPQCQRPQGHLPRCIPETREPGPLLHAHRADTDR